LAHFVRQERSDSTKCDKEIIRLKQLLETFIFATTQFIEKFIFDN
jgi:hypothetical protein